VEAKEFFEVIFGDGEGEAVLVLPNREGKPTNDYWFTYPAQLEEMADFVWSYGSAPLCSPAASV
jgi:hypothetical protein